ncbi:MAG: adenylate kinase [Actinomycetota bacterium]|nr:adenylate kinase [Actinomycetota bacterium]
MSALNLVLLGPPGSGKGTQGERLQADLELPYYATGNILREAVREQTNLGKEAKSFMDRGDLVPDDVIVGVIADRLASHEAEDGFILDGFPRTVGQADALSARMKELGKRLTAAILIDVTDEEVVRRLGGRRTCPNGHVFHAEFDPPQVEGVCDVCGEALIVRDDDEPDVIQHRLVQYKEKTAPLVDFYDQAGVLERIAGNKPPDDVYEEVRGLLATLRMEEEA